LSITDRDATRRSDGPFRRVLQPVHASSRQIGGSVDDGHGPAGNGWNRSGVRLSGHPTKEPRSACRNGLPLRMAQDTPWRRARWLCPTPLFRRGWLRKLLQGDRFAVCAAIDGCGPHQRRPERAVGHSTRCVDVPVAEDFPTNLFRLPALLGLQHRLLGQPFKQRIEIGLHLARDLLSMPVPKVNDEPLGSSGGSRWPTGRMFVMSMGCAAGRRSCLPRRSAASANRARSMRWCSAVLRMQSRHLVRKPVGLSDAGKNILAGLTSWHASHSLA
jgi:hypothetical protein